jgi:S-adenosylmethionine decarboxylase
MPKKKSTNKNNRIETVKFGTHLVYDAYGCPKEKLENKDQCSRILEEIVKVAEMHKISETVLIEADGNETLGGKDPGGFSGFVIIQESHISLHTFAKRGFVTVDVYSCKEFDATTVIDFLNEIFEPEDYHVFKMDRGMKYPASNIYK